MKKSWISTLCYLRCRYKNRRIRWLNTLVLLGCFLAGPALCDEYGERRAHILLNSMKYIKGINAHSNLTVFVITNQENEQSQLQAKILKKNIEILTLKDNLAIHIDIIDITQMDKLKMGNIAYVTDGLQKHFPDIYSATRKKSVFAIGDSVQCAKIKCCILAYDVVNGMDIYLNQSTLRASGFGLDPAFKFIVKRV